MKSDLILDIKGKLEGSQSVLALFTFFSIICLLSSVYFLANDKMNPGYILLAVSCFALLLCAWLWYISYSLGSSSSPISTLNINYDRSSIEIASTHERLFDKDQHTRILEIIQRCIVQKTLPAPHGIVNGNPSNEGDLKIINEDEKNEFIESNKIELETRRNLLAEYLKNNGDNLKKTKQII